MLHGNPLEVQANAEQFAKTCVSIVRLYGDVCRHLNKGSQFFFRRCGQHWGLESLAKFVVFGPLVLGPLVPWSLVPWSSGPWGGLLEIVPSCRQSVCKLGGRRPPQPPRFFKLYKATSSIILPAKTEPIWPLFRTRKWGGGLRPFFLHRAGFLSRTLHHQQDLLRANCYRPVQIPSCRQSICKRGGCLPPNPGASKNRSHMDLLHPACRQSICKWGGYVSPNPALF